MKRFFCTICGRVKRVRTLPRNVQSVNSVTPEKRIGACDRHFADPSDEKSAGKSRQLLNMASQTQVPVTVIRSRRTGVK